METLKKLIIEERVRQTEKWGKQQLTLTGWLLVLQEEMGEVARAMLETANPESARHQREEAVQVTAVAVQMCEWLSELHGWPCSAEELLDRTFAKYELSLGDPAQSYTQLTQLMGALAEQILSRANAHNDEISKIARRLTIFGLELTYRFLDVEEVSDSLSIPMVQ